MKDQIYHIAFKVLEYKVDYFDAQCLIKKKLDLFALKPHFLQNAIREVDEYWYKKILHLDLI